MATTSALVIAAVFLGAAQAMPQASNKNSPIGVAPDTQGATTFSFGGSIYQIPPFPAKSWQEAKYNCKAMGMELVSIETPEEQAVIQEAARNINAVLWTSLNSRYRTGTYIWESTGLTEEVYSNWLLGSNAPVSGLNCVALGYSNRVWMLSDCLAEARYICEKRVGCSQ